MDKVTPAVVRQDGVAVNALLRVKKILAPTKTLAIVLYVSVLIVTDTVKQRVKQHAQITNILRCKMVVGAAATMIWVMLPSMVVAVVG
tara:strand:+ start:376 stop:639 length:264 start_codon:yes stop_codon:yes gene_type:complete